MTTCNVLPLSFVLVLFLVSTVQCQLHSIYYPQSPQSPPQSPLNSSFPTPHLSRLNPLPRLPRILPRKPTPLPQPWPLPRQKQRHRRQHNRNARKQRHAPMHMNTHIQWPRHQAYPRARGVSEERDDRERTPRVDAVDIENVVVHSDVYPGPVDAEHGCCAEARPGGDGGVVCPGEPEETDW